MKKYIFKKLLIEKWRGDVQIYQNHLFRWTITVVQLDR